MSDWAEIIARAKPCDVAELSQGAPIVMMAPHPDDESLGCGALLAAAFQSVGAHVVGVTDGRRSHPNSARYPGDALATLRAQEMVEAVSRLGGGPDDVTMLGCGDSRIPKGEALQPYAQRVADLCERLGARSLFVSTRADPHQDHVASEALARRVIALSPALALYTYPVWSRYILEADLDPIASAPAYLLPTEPWRETKRSAIEAHRSQRGLIIDDDPDGFVLPEDFVALFSESDEVYFDAREADAGQ